MSARLAEGLAVSDLRAGYRDAVVIDGISLALAPGATLAVLGRNGVGKTTLLATLMGHTTQHGGSIRFRGAELGGLPAYRRAALGLALVPQEREARVYDFFPALAARRRNRGDQLSGGEQQMLAIARALMGIPALLMMDEPLEGLAPVIVDAVLAGLDRLKREDALALLLVEQNARLALEFTERAIVLDRGAIVFSGASRELLAAPERLGALLGVGRKAG